MQSAFVIITKLLASKNDFCKEVFCNNFGRDGKLFVPPLRPRVCSRDKPGFAGLPLYKVRRKPGFVPGFHRVRSKDKPGLSPGLPGVVPRATGLESSCFMCLILA